FDFAAQRKTEQTSDLNYDALLAVDSSGRAFLRGNYFRLESTAPVGVFSPNLPDLRPTLEVERHPVVHLEHVLASDDKLWVVRKDGIARFDGHTWELIHPLSRGQAIPTLAGREGIVLCRNNNGIEYQLFEDNQLVAVAPLRRLIAAYPKKFAAAFPPSYTPLQRNYRLWIAADT